jgi:hypothetical protein
MATAEPESFPFEAVRDLLGILRALYAAHKARGASTVRLRQIQKLALGLQRATALAEASGAGTAESRRAFEMAEQATHGLADLVDVTTPLEPTLLVAGERVRSHRTRASLREAARRARLTRS